MIFVILLVLSPLVAGSFTSMCPQQPNNVVVNCNNANPPYIPNYPNFPRATGRVLNRVLDIGYNKPPPGSKLELPIDRSYESRSSEESNESRESSEEIHDHQIPLSVMSHHHVPSIHTSTTVNNRLDFINSLRRINPNLDANKLRSVLRSHIPSHIGQEKLGQITTGSGLSEILGTGHETTHDETHGHGHTGQYNHDLSEHEQHGHEHGHHEHHDHHDHDHNHGYVNNHEMNNRPQLLIPAHITHIPHTTTISGAHTIPERLEFPTGLIMMDRGDPRTEQISLPIEAHGHGTTGQFNYAMDLLRDSYDRFILSTRGFKSLDTPLRGTYELYPQDLLNRIITTIPVSTVSQSGLDTEINCDQIPIISEIPQTQNKKEVVTMVSQSEKLPNTEVSIEPSMVVADGNIKIPSTQQGSTITKVTTTKVEERPINTQMAVPQSETIVYGMPIQTGSTNTKVTTNKLDEQLTSINTAAPIVENMVHKMPVQSGAGGSTITTITTTTVEERPITSETKEMIFLGTPIQTDSTVTTTLVDSKPTIAEIPIPTVDKVVHEDPVQTDSTVTKVTTTTVEERPMTLTIEDTFQETPDEISEILSTVNDTEKVSDPFKPPGEMIDSTIVNSAKVNSSPLLRLVRPIRDGTNRYDSYRQRSGPSVIHV